MSPLSSAPTSATKRFALLASLAIGSALALGSGCTFDPPDSIPLNSEGGVDGGGGGGTDGGPGGAADGGEVSGETMSITFTSQPVGNVATYAPRNVIAAWIEDANGTFVQTINRQANARADNLVAWTLKSGGKNVDQDAVTGATRPNHATAVTAIWEIPEALADGIYTIRVETCDENSNSADQNTQGTFTFEKNGTASTQTPIDLGYTNVTIDYSGRL